MDTIIELQAEVARLENELAEARQTLRHAILSQDPPADGVLAVLDKSNCS